MEFSLPLLLNQTGPKSPHLGGELIEEKQKQHRHLIRDIGAATYLGFRQKGHMRNPA